MAIAQPSYHFINDFNNKAELANNIGCVSLINIPIDYYKNEKRNTLKVGYCDRNFWEIMNLKFIEGRPFSQKEMNNGDRVIIIDEATRNLIFGNQKANGKFIELQGNRILVTGVVNNISRLNFLSYGNIWMPITLMEGVDNKDSKGASIAITTYRNKEDIDKINVKLERYLSNMELPKWHNNVKGLFEKGVWSLFGNTLDIKNIKSLITFIIPLIVLLYFAMPIFNLYALFGMRLSERACEIGLRKSFGATRKTIRNQFIVENLFVVLSGSIIAFLLTIITLNLINYFQIFANSKLQINLNAFLISLLVSVLFGLLAGYIPSIKVSKITIVETLNTKTND
ncbi:Macrolide export ATP-binding/permease protein MacB [subsurface metagenome]